MNQRIKYIETTLIKVQLDGKIVGEIKKGERGYSYYTKGKKTADETFESLDTLKRQLEEI